jgi:NADH-quinone oxidoreductase subunit C
MTSQQITQLLKEQFGEKIQVALPDDKHPRVHVDAGDWREVASFLRNDARLKMDWLANLSGVDYAADQKMCVVYDLWSFDLRHTFAVKVYCPRSNPRVPSVVDLWAAANWNEREAYDMFGIIFEGHPDLRRILCADDWEGYPLRKDYVFPREYHGIPASVELDWQQQPDYPKGNG